MIATRRSPGTSSRSRSSRLPARSVDRTDSPVTLPPGRARLATSPLPTGSPAAVNTIGIAVVTCFAAVISGVPEVTIISTLRRANSAAISAARSLRPSVQRYSIATVRPSIQESSRSRSTKAATRLASAAGVPWPMYPMIGSLPGCCARAASGHSRRAAKKRDELAPLHAPSGEDQQNLKAARCDSNVRFGSLADKPSGATNDAKCQ